MFNRVKRCLIKCSFSLKSCGRSIAKVRLKKVAKPTFPCFLFNRTLPSLLFSCKYFLPFPSFVLSRSTRHCSELKPFCMSLRGAMWDRLALNLDAHLKEREEALEEIEEGMKDEAVADKDKLMLQVCKVTPCLLLAVQSISSFLQPTLSNYSSRDLGLSLFPGSSNKDIES